MEHTKHLWRAILMILSIVVLYIVGRVLFVGLFYPTFGEYGSYRGESLREEAAFEIRHGAGIKSCKQCHEEKVRDFLKTAHAVVNCETCHAPLITHVQFDDFEGFLADPDSYERTGSMEIQHAKDLCIRCHESQPAKPGQFPKIVIVDHLEEMGVENSADVCLDCHDPHDPSM
jgi:hypothetical protein